MKSALILVALALSAGAAAQEEQKKLAGDVLCQDDLLICRESCSLEAGTRAHARERVAKCLYRCEQAHTVCLTRQIAKRKAAPRATETPEKEKPVQKEEYFSGAPTRFSQQNQEKPAPPAQPTEEVAPVRRNVTRTTELEAAPDREMHDYPEREGAVTRPPARETNELGY